MIELDKHIEILLLNNDCVIVPNLGGFMAHHVEAHFDEQEQMFLPPLRTLGFNPQLKLNDSLLAQSYIEAYDISYPEALRRIEDEVSELKQHLENEGSYELNDIGTLFRNEEGNYVFEPCEAGILTPDLYGLSSFEMKQIGAEVKKPQLVPVSVLTDTEDRLEDDVEETEEKIIRIKVAWLRNAVAVAAAVLAFFLFTTPVSNSVTTQVNMSALHDNALTKLIPQELTKGEVKDNSEEIKQSIAKADSIANAQKEESKEAVAVKEPVKEEGYCIVLASHVALKNAEEYVSKLHNEGYEQAYTYQHNKIVRVVYGTYESESEAYNELRTIRGNKHFEQSWVLKKK